MRTENLPNTIRSVTFNKISKLKEKDALTSSGGPGCLYECIISSQKKNLVLCFNEMKWAHDDNTLHYSSRPGTHLTITALIWFKFEM